MSNPFRRTGAALSGLILVAVAVIAFVVWDATRGNSNHATTTTGTSTPQLSEVAYGLLFNAAVVHKTRINVLSQWPKPPYQTYTSGPETCFEWWDKPVALYNLCFLNGLLVDKSIE